MSTELNSRINCLNFYIKNRLVSSKQVLDLILFITINHNFPKEIFELL